MEELDMMSAFGNGMQAELSKEFDNGRMMRLLVKLGFVNERPEVDGDTHWSETGDRYLLKLFRDFVFHQCTESGSPVLDWGHVVESLNKLDAGIEEKILLLSRDEQSMLVASYGDLKRCVEAGYLDLVARGKKDKGS
jgi:PAB-dependent poly(A)-specific ribonuclease subunit 3